MRTEVFLFKTFPLARGCHLTLFSYAYIFHLLLLLFQSQTFAFFFLKMILNLEIFYPPHSTAFLLHGEVNEIPLLLGFLYRFRMLNEN